MSFDFDPQSVACTLQLRRRFADETADWFVTQGSVLDAEFLDGLGMFDVVYSWGALHHTGAMWDACGNIATRVEPGGRLFISIYNDQGIASSVWRRVKRRYNVSRGLGRWLTLHAVDLYFRLRSMAARTGLGQDRPNRGMDRRYDMIDWVGGYPFEVAGLGEVFEFFHRVGFALDRMRTTSGIGCNEFDFTRVS